MSLPTVAGAACIPAMRDDAIAKVREFEAIQLAQPQRAIDTHHVIHAGMYARTICIPAGVVLTGALIKLATLLISDGDAVVFVGDHCIDLVGRHVIPASAGRKQAFFARADTHLTMVFATAATSVAEAEAKFTDEAELLFSRQPEAVNHITITGE